MKTISEKPNEMICKLVYVTDVKKQSKQYLYLPTHVEAKI